MFEECLCQSDRGLVEVSCGATAHRTVKHVRESYLGDKALLNCAGRPVGLTFSQFVDLSCLVLASATPGVRHFCKVNGPSREFSF